MLQASVVRRSAALVLGVVALIVATPSISLAATFPPATVSWYVTNYTTADWYSRGCTVGAAALNGSVPQQTIVILDFATEIKVNGVWGAEWNGVKEDRIFHPYTQIEAVIDSYANGFWYCSGSDTTAHITIAAGVRNLFVGSPDVGTQGLAWAELMTTFNNSLGTWGSQASVAAAIDAEPSWSSPSAATGWATGYSNANGLPYYDYGSADGCPPYGSCNNGWSQSTEYTMSYGLPAAFAAPEIYTTSGSQAQQWQQISLWGYNNGGYGRIFFSSSVTQWNACQSRQCNGTNNLPVTGWTQLLNDVQADSRTTISTIPYTTDFNWH